MNGRLFKPDNIVLCEIGQENKDDGSYSREAGEYIDIPNFSLLFEYGTQDLYSFTETNSVIMSVEMRYDSVTRRIDGDSRTFVCFVRVTCEKCEEYLVSLEQKLSTKVLHDLESNELKEMYSKCFAMYNKE